MWLIQSVETLHCMFGTVPELQDLYTDATTKTKLQLLCASTEAVHIDRGSIQGGTLVTFPVPCVHCAAMLVTPATVSLWLAHAQLCIKKACLSSTDLIKQQIDIKLRHTNKQLC